MKWGAFTGSLPLLRFQANRTHQLGIGSNLPFDKSIERLGRHLHGFDAQSSQLVPHFRLGERLAGLLSELFDDYP